MSTGLGSLASAFAQCRASGESALVAYAMAGDPTCQRSIDTFAALADGGADVIEIGVPFSDPIADGPVIQQASERALAAGTSLGAVLRWIPAIQRRTGSLPLLLMTYANLIENVGPGEFARAAAEAGVAGAIVPDLPFEESAALGAALGDLRLALVPLCSPSTSAERASRIARDARGFIYCVAVAGVTGERAQLPPELEARLALLRGVSPVPVVAGFGVSSPTQARALAPHADGVVVGSALVRAACEGGPTAARRLCESLKRALREGRLGGRTPRGGSGVDRDD